MATIQFKSGDEYLLKISKLEALAKGQVIGGAIYGAAEIVADEIRSELNKVPTDEKWGESENQTAGPRKIQKLGLEQSLGIAKMQDDGRGYYNVKIGFDGYNKVVTERWPNGQPNQMIARSVERGTSYMKSTPFVKRAVRQSRKKAIEYMRETVDKETEKIMKG